MPRSANHPDLAAFLGALCRFGPVDGAFAIIVEAWLIVQSALPMPIEDRRAGAALRDGFRAPGRMIAHVIKLTRRAIFFPELVHMTYEPTVLARVAWAYWQSRVRRRMRGARDDAAA